MRAGQALALLSCIMSINNETRIPVTDAMLQALKDWHSKTGFGIGSIFKYAEKEKLFVQTRTLRPAAFYAIKRGQTRSVVKSDFETLIRVYEALPKEYWMKQLALSRRKERVVVTPELREQMKDFFDNQAVGRASLFRAYGAPQDLRVETITRIINGRVDTILKTHADFLNHMLKAHR